MVTLRTRRHFRDLDPLALRVVPGIPLRRHDYGDCMTRADANINRIQAMFDTGLEIRVGDAMEHCER
jgi:hypothetical protein